MIKVLHLTEAFGGGIQTAICSYVKSTAKQNISHSLVARLRVNDDTKINTSNLFTAVNFVTGNLATFFIQANKAINEIKPDFIHLHSSFAGFLGRWLFTGDAKIIYTPHCYAFEREDIPNWKKSIYKKLEQIGLSKIDVIAGCSERECELATAIGAKNTLFVNNYSEIEFRPQPKVKVKTFNLVLVGRICFQKDPLFLVDVVRELQTYPEYAKINITWLGGGETHLEQMLRDENIKVTGMQPHQHMISMLADADLYLHTAAWEGMPLTILEAAKLQRPMIIRKIGATKNYQYPFLADSPKEMANQIIAFIHHHNDSIYQDSIQWFNHSFNANNQAQALKQLYTPITSEVTVNSYV